MLDTAALRIASRKIEPTKPRERDRAGAHRAGFQRDIEIALADTLRGKRGAGKPDREDFGMRRGIVAFARAVACTCDDHAVMHDSSTDGHLAALAGCPRLGECLIEAGQKAGRTVADFLSQGPNLPDRSAK